LRDWYRNEFKWGLDRKLEYARLYRSPNRQESLDHVAGEAERIFDKILNNHGFHLDYGVKFLSFIESEMHPLYFLLEYRLVARRVVIAALLHTARWTDRGPEWDVDAFHNLLPHSPNRSVVQAVYDVVNFNEALWLSTSKPDLLSRLLKEEYEWLLALDWPGRKAGTICRCVRQAYERACKPGP